MIKTEFHEPSGKIIENIDISEMKKNTIDQFDKYWTQGSGDGLIDYIVDGYNKYSMLIGPNNRYGIYLHFIENEGDNHWLSLNNKDNLDKVTETADEVYASIGLFLPIDIAWEGIKEFLLTGKRSEMITWVKPEVIPVNGNW